MQGLSRQQFQSPTPLNTNYKRSARLAPEQKSPFHAHHFLAEEESTSKPNLSRTVPRTQFANQTLLLRQTQPYNNDAQSIDNALTQMCDLVS